MAMGLWWLRCPAAVVVVLAMSVGRATAEVEIGCLQPLMELLVCNDYLDSKAPTPSANCCAVVKSLDEIASASPANRQDMCECFRESGGDSGPPDTKSPKAQQLPTLCHASDNIKFGPKFVCNYLLF